MASSPSASLALPQGVFPTKQQESNHSQTTLLFSSFPAISLQAQNTPLGSQQFYSHTLTSGLGFFTLNSGVFFLENQNGQHDLIQQVLQATLESLERIQEIFSTQALYTSPEGNSYFVIPKPMKDLTQPIKVIQEVLQQL